jgi:hypothetical protein
MELLKKEQTMEFFSMIAFWQSRPPITLKSIIKKVANACNGLSLSLEVMGLWLYGKWLFWSLLISFNMATRIWDFGGW